MTHTVTTGEFEGPLGILLDLVERGRLEVTAISVAEITGEYLKRIHHLEERLPEKLAEFLKLGARLLYIKSLALLPGEAADEQGEELHQLGLELEDYRRFQAAARLLAGRTDRTWERAATPRLEARDLPLPNVSLKQLTDAFARAMSQRPPAPESGVVRRHLSLEAAVAKLRRRLADGFELQDILDACRDRAEVIVAFLALLELVRDGAARVEQAGAYAPIRVEAARV